MIGTKPSTPRSSGRERTSPMLLLRPVTSDTTYDRSLRTYETVVRDTPAALAISWEVINLLISRDDSLLHARIGTELSLLEWCFP